MHEQAPGTHADDVQPGAAGSVWPPGDRMPTVEIALILCVNAGASARHP